jgi:hypothetical protein
MSERRITTFHKAIMLPSHVLDFFFKNMRGTCCIKREKEEYMTQ